MSIGWGKSSWQNPTPIRLRTVSKLIEENYLKTIKGMCQKSEANIAKN